MSLLTSIFSKLCSRTFNPASVSSLNRFNKYRYGSSYEGEGRTVVNMLNKDIDAGILIEAFSIIGFRFTNGISVIGPVLVFPKTVLSWKIKNPFEINRESLCLFEVLEPKVDILVIGIGDKSNMNMSSKLVKLSQDLKCNIEVLPTQHAIASFNFLNAENRNVAAALFPPETMSVNSDDLMQTGLKQTIITGDVFSP